MTAVKVSFRPEMDGGTRITLEHTGWKDTVASLQAREWHVDAWRGMLASLLIPRRPALPGLYSAIRDPFSNVIELLEFAE